MLNIKRLRLFAPGNAKVNVLKKQQKFSLNLND